ncbi:MAG: hypothetical protein HGA22_05345, partial [Clostridiales bacterium]|nr:hypothetical protein [Clostridiales bacterium]
MGKIAIIEDIGVLKIRLEKILLKNGFSDIVFYSSNITSMASLTYLLKDISLLIVDLDHHELNPIKLMQTVRGASNLAVPIIALNKGSGLQQIKKAIALGYNDF